MHRHHASDSSIGGSNSLLCCPPHWQQGSLESIVGVWQLSAPWHLSACCSPSGTYRCWGCALHICLSGEIELFPSRWNIHHARKLQVMEIQTSVWHWRCLRLYWVLWYDSMAARADVRFSVTSEAQELSHFWLTGPEMYVFISMCVWNTVGPTKPQNEGQYWSSISTLIKAEKLMWRTPFFLLTDKLTFANNN